MRALVSNIVTEDYVNFAELGGVNQHQILLSYIMRNAMAPQLTALALSLGLIFNGAVITEVVFGYPGVGNLLIRAVYAGDYSLVHRHRLDIDHRGRGGGASSSTCCIR